MTRWDGNPETAPDAPPEDLVVRCARCGDYREPELMVGQVCEQCSQRPIPQPERSRELAGVWERYELSEFRSARDLEIW